MFLKVKNWKLCLMHVTPMPSFFAEGFNIFEGEALEYLFDACALTPMAPSMQRILMFLKMEHRDICLLLVH